MQVSHVHTAATVAQSHHRPAAAHHGIADWIGLLGAIVILIGVPSFCLFVMYRFWRFFFRVTR